MVLTPGETGRWFSVAFILIMWACARVHTLLETRGLGVGSLELELELPEVGAGN